MSRETVSLHDELQDARVHLITVRDSGTRTVTQDPALKRLLDTTLAYVSACEDRLDEHASRDLA